MDQGNLRLRLRESLALILSCEVPPNTLSPRASRSGSLKVVLVLVVVVVLLLLLVVTFCKNLWKCLRSYRGRNLVELLYISSRHPSTKTRACKYFKQNLSERLRMLCILLVLV